MVKDLAVKKLTIHFDSQPSTQTLYSGEYLNKPTIEAEPAVEVSQVSTTPNWQSSIIDYLVNGTLHTERLESRKLQMKAARYYIWNGILVRRSYTNPHLHCLALPDDLKVVSSIYDGVYGNHFGG
ncbi:hypothetical protein ACFX1Z_018731 [Malus domestica]